MTSAIGSRRRSQETVHGAQVLIHVEPEAEAKHAGIVPMR